MSKVKFFDNDGFVCDTDFTGTVFDGIRIGSKPIVNNVIGFSVDFGDDVFIFLYGYKDSHINFNSSYLPLCKKLKIRQEKQEYPFAV
jgi:hypothetical protein